MSTPRREPESISEALALVDGVMRALGTDTLEIALWKGDGPSTALVRTRVGGPARTEYWQIPNHAGPEGSEQVLNDEEVSRHLTPGEIVAHLRFLVSERGSRPHGEAARLLEATLPLA